MPTRAHAPSHRFTGVHAPGIDWDFDLAPGGGLDGQAQAGFDPTVLDTAGGT